MSPDRRTLLSAGLVSARLVSARLGVTAALASRTGKATTPAQTESCDWSSAGNELSCDADDRAAVAHDFGNIVHRQPRAVLKPASAADIGRLIRRTSTLGLKVAARGQGHSTFGRPLTEGVVIEMGALSAIHQIRSDRIVVEAGATWERVLDVTLAQGLTPPVLTNYLGLSVGGTISVGGIGAGSSRQGMQTDHVLELDVVTGQGEELTCSPASNPGLFDAVRGGLAQCGLITRATLRLVRAPERVRRFQLLYPDLASLAADQRRALAEDRFDQLQGAILPDGAGGWRFQLEGALFYDRDLPPDDDAVFASLSSKRDSAVVTDLTYRALAFAKLEALLRSKGLWSNPHPWLFTFLRGDNAEQLAHEILDQLSSEEIGPLGRVTFYPMQTRAFGTPLVRLPDTSMVFPFNIVHFPASTDTAKVEQTVSKNRLLYDRIRLAGGVQYPVSAIPMAPEDWKDHFGSMWPRLCEAKRRCDPLNLLTPGYNLF